MSGAGAAVSRSAPTQTRGQQKTTSIIPYENKHKPPRELNKTKTTTNLPPFPNLNKSINSISNNSNLQDDDSKSLFKIADTFHSIALLPVFIFY